jgi:AcrR family transcriptional regulator
VPRRIDPHARGAVVAEAVRSLVRAGGIEAVTVRAVADAADIATSSLRLHYRDKAFLMRCMVWHCVEHFVRETWRFRSGDDPVADVVDLLTTQLPDSDEDRDQALLWLAFVERARWCDDDAREALRQQRANWAETCESAVRHLGVPASAQPVEGQRLALLLEALLGRICDGIDPLDLPAAVALLRQHVHLVRWVVDRSG